MGSVYRSGGRTAFAVWSIDGISCSCIPYSLWVAHPFVRTYRTTFAGIPEWYFYRSNQENDGAEYREDREFCGTHDSRFSQCAGNRCADVYRLFFAERVDGSHLCGLYRLQHRFAVYEFLWQES